MKIGKDSVVSIHYKLTDDSGEVLDSSEGGEPLAYLHGHDNIISGLEEALGGRESGDAFQVVVDPDGGYGERDEDAIETVPKSSFEGVEQVEVGMQFRTSPEDGQRIITVTEVDGDDVTIDSNHPLAGERLTFDVEVVEVRSATEEELAHGHVHAHGHHH